MTVPAVVRALVVTPDGSARLIPVEVNLSALQSVVGGYLEAVSLRADCHAYCNEEGKLLGLPVNGTATVLAGRLGWPGVGSDVLCGPVLFLGSDSDGGEADVPERVVDLACEFTEIRTDPSSTVT